MTSARRRPHLLMLEVLIGGLLAAGAIGLLSGGLRASRAEHANQYEARLAAHFLGAEKVRFYAGSDAQSSNAARTRVVGDLRSTWTSSAPRRENATSSNCEKVRISITTAKGEKKLEEDVERCP